jgi:hypothetical protein
VADESGTGDVFPPSPVLDRSLIQQAERPAPGVIRFLPLLFFFTYLNATVLIFAFGPWPWPVRNSLKLYGFLALAHTALVIGYLKGIRKAPRPSRVRWSPVRLVGISIILNLALLVPTLRYRTGGHVDLAASMANPGAAYRIALSAPINRPDLRLVEYARDLFGPLLYLLLPLSVVYWRDLGLWGRIGAILAIAGELSIWLATGRTKGIAELFIVVPWLVLIQQRARSRAEWSRAIRATSGLLGLGAIAVSAVFIFFVSSRSPSNEVSTFDKDAQIDARIPLDGKLGTVPKKVILGLSSYLSQGYYGLSLGLDEPFVPSWGLGHSTVLMVTAEKVTGNQSLHERTYPARIEKEGWEALSRYHTFYLWIASDVTFLGTIVVVYFLGRLLATSWISTVQGRDPAALTVFYLVLLICYYIPANNQVSQYGELMTAFWVSLGVWWTTTEKKGVVSGRGVPET